MDYYFQPYVTVEEQRKRAEKAKAKLIKKGLKIKPIEPFSGKIAKTFWGKSWCDNLELYADEINRLDRGKRYARAGTICHLEAKGRVVKAMISGSELYNTEISFAPLSRPKWEDLKSTCSSDLGSLLDLLSGQLSKDVMKAVCDPENGLFPQIHEIGFACDCPDSAIMCKHVAAAMFGIGRRLDEEPALIFQLRGVNPEELINAELNIPAFETDSELENLEDIFGINLDNGEQILSDLEVKSSKTKENQAVASEGAAKPKTSVINRLAQEKPLLYKIEKVAYYPDNPSGAAIRQIRKLAGLTQVKMAKAINISLPTIIRWEHEKSPSLQKGSKDKLLAFYHTIAGE